MRGGASTRRRRRGGGLIGGARTKKRPRAATAAKRKKKSGGGSGSSGSRRRGGATGGGDGEGDGMGGGGGGGRGVGARGAAARCNPASGRRRGTCLTAAHRARLDSAAAAASGGRAAASKRRRQRRCSPDDEVCAVQTHPAPAAVRAAVLADAFVPARPARWKTHPSTWLMNDDIDSVLHQYAAACPHFHYTGFGFMDFAADERAPVAPRGSPFEPLSDDEDDGGEGGGGDGGGEGGGGDGGGGDGEGGDGDEEYAAAAARSAGGASRVQQPDAPTPEHCVSPAVCSLDVGELAKRGVTLAAAVLNLSRHVEKGTHWVFVVLFLPPPGGGRRAEMVYFDSNADATPPEVERWHARLAAQWSAARGEGAELRLRRNAHARQRTDSECGMWCLVCLVSLVRGRWLTASDAEAGGAALDAAPACAADPTATVPRMLNELLDASLPITDALAARFRSVFFHH